MHAGLITFHFAHHYGARLQALATIRAIQSPGHDCEIIDHHLPHTTRTSQLFKKSGGVCGMASDAHTALHYGMFQRRFRRSEAFVAEEMVLSPRRYIAFEQSQVDPPAYDVCVTGSDQIQNPYIFQDRQFGPSFLLGFVREGHRIVYTPGLGVPELSEDKAEELRRFLTSFSTLSMWEKRGQILLREAARRDVRVVLDLTLLLTGEDWGELAAAPKRQGSYILCYFVSDPDEAVPYALALSARTGWPIVQPAGARRKIDGADELVFDTDPQEFLSLFWHVSVVVTNSFHGTAFSPQFQKDFFTSTSPRERAKPIFPHIYNLFSRLGCADRILSLDTTAPMDAPIDYGAVYEKLAATRADSLFYLGAAIENAPLPTEEPGPQAAPRLMLCRAEDYTGYTTCASVCPVDAIIMKPDHKGSLRPVTGKRYIPCHRCEQTYPILHPPMPGPAPATTRAVWNRDEAEWTASSSSGSFSLLARRVLEQGGAVFGVALDGSMTTRHVCVRTVEKLTPMRSSRYVQSDLGDNLSQIKALLEEGAVVLFSGVPCQMGGLEHYLEEDYPNLLTCDLVYHGVPSPAVFRAYLDGLEAARGSEIVSVRFKDRSHGQFRLWFTARFTNGSVYTEDSNRTGYGRGFGMQLFLRPACARCQYASTSRPADFTLADYWGLDEKLALPVERGGGVSMVLVSSARGQTVFDALSPWFGQVERPLAEAVAGNLRLASPLKANPHQAAFFATFTALPFAEVERRPLVLPSLPYRTAAKALIPAMKEKVRKLLE